MGKKELKAILAKHDINATDDELQQMIDLISLNGTCVHFLNKSSNIENEANLKFEFRFMLQDEVYASSQKESNKKMQFRKKIRYLHHLFMKSPF